MLSETSSSPQPYIASRPGVPRSRASLFSESITPPTPADPSSLRAIAAATTGEANDVPDTDLVLDDFDSYSDSRVRRELRRQCSRHDWRVDRPARSRPPP